MNTPATPLPPSEPQGVDQLGHGKPRRPVLIAAAIVAAIVVVAAGVWFGLQQFGTDSDDSNEAAATTTSPTSSTSPDEATTTTSTSTPSTDEGASGGSVTTATTTATTVPESTTTTPTVTTVAPPTTSAQRFSYVGGRYPSVAEGEFAYSGCTPGPADLLPDGVWYGFAPTWSTIDIVFDLACVSYTFDASCSCDVPTVTNNNTLLRTLPLAPTAAAYGASDGYQTGPMTVTEFTADPGSDADAYRYLAGLELVISVNDGLVTEIAIPIRP